MFSRIWKRKRFEESETFEQILLALKLSHAKLVDLDKEVDMLKLKWKDTMFKKKLKEAPEEEEEQTKKSVPSDGFDEIRKMRKDLNTERIGI